MATAQDEELRLWGQNIRALREACEWSQKTLGDKFDPPVHQTTIARWERGQMEPKREHKRRLAEVLNTDVRVLFPMVRGAA